MSSDDLTNTYRNQLNAEQDRSNRIQQERQTERELAFADEVYSSSNLTMLKAENARLKALLCRPFAEIAEKNLNFKKTYDEQQEFLAEWMVSQKAFKELAIQFGIELGKTREEVIEMGLANDIKVLNNQTQFNNNAENSSIIRPHIEALKAKLNKN